MRFPKRKTVCENERKLLRERRHLLSSCGEDDSSQDEYEALLAKVYEMALALHRNAGVDGDAACSDRNAGLEGESDSPFRSVRWIDLEVR